MAGPLSGIAGQQQVPLSQQGQTNQNQNNSQIRDQVEEDSQQDQVQPQQAAPVSDTQSTETSNQNILQQQIEELVTSQLRGGSDLSQQPRGSVVDITV